MKKASKSKATSAKAAKSKAAKKAVKGKPAKKKPTLPKKATASPKDDESEFPTLPRTFRPRPGRGARAGAKLPG